MAVTTRVPEPHQTRDGHTVSALLIPADIEQPLQRIEIDGVPDVRRAVGGPICGFAYPPDATIWGYADARDTCAPTARANPRASSILDTGQHNVTGHVVVVAFDADRQERDLPAGFEQRIEQAFSPGKPSLTMRRGSTAAHEWEIEHDDSGTPVVALLTVTYHPAGLDAEAGERRPSHFAAVLAKKTQATDGNGSEIPMIPFTGLTVCRQDAPAFSQTALDLFDATALARLLGLYLASDPDVARYFRHG